jgi:hypothetical protein
MSENDHREETSVGQAVAWSVVAVLIIPFIPLILSIAESLLFHSHRVEDACRAIGIHAALSKLYNSVFDVLGRLFKR